MWDDSLLTREEADARTKRKVEAVIKRERALAYAYSHQVIALPNPFSSRTRKLRQSNLWCRSTT
jgi:hypothetical protein